MAQAGTNGSNGTDVGTTITTQGDILYRDGSGLQRLAKGTASQVLTINSGATAPEWAEASGGSWNVVSSALASSSSELVLSGMDATYETYCAVFSGIRPSANNGGVKFRIGDSSSFKSDAGYMYASSYHHGSTSTQTPQYSGGTNQWYLWNGGSTANATDYGASAQMYIYTPRTDSSPTSLVAPMVYGHCVNRNTSNNVYREEMAGTYNTNINTTRLQIFPISGTFVTGRATLYGIKHS
jgi:hypothetical protein